MPPQASGKAVKKAVRPKEIRAVIRKEEEAQEGIFRYLHLQSLETGPPRYWNFKQSHVYHEFFREQHFRAHCSRIFPISSLQQKAQSPVGNPTAVRLLLPGELAKHAVSEGTKQSLSTLQVNVEILGTKKKGL
ncbi:hypothetical protein AVEN_7811-1 [Araneus ventricosus]|uniref:Histone H2B n=1 Tax=Araneus ventricosus TaxID=182803 RepID=A0A4Y2S7W8_ARAVE|nr:hypothetical protein AVEN_7811-1 [Araneus ventricosus]